MGRAPSRLGNPGWTRRRRRSKPRIAPGAYLRDQTRRGTSEASFTSKPTFATLALPRRVAWSTNMVQDREVNSSTAGKTIDRSIRWDTISVWVGILVPQPNSNFPSQIKDFQPAAFRKTAVVHNNGPQRGSNGVRSVPAAAWSYMVFSLQMACRAWRLPCLGRAYCEPENA
jgi:hypothetical protein